MKAITLDEAKQDGWDVILAGSSFAACFFAKFATKLLSRAAERGGDVADTIIDKTGADK